VGRTIDVGGSGMTTFGGLRALEEKWPFQRYDCAVLSVLPFVSDGSLMCRLGYDVEGIRG
jgi:hypothetical protein